MSNTADVPKKWENGKRRLTHGTRKPNEAFRSASAFVAIYVEIVVYGRVVMNVRAVDLRIDGKKNLRGWYVVREN